MLDHKVGLHPEFGGFLNTERLAFQRLEASRCGEINGDVRSAFSFQGKSFDDTAALILGVDAYWGTG